MEFLVEFEVNVPDGTPDDEVKGREDAEAGAAGPLSARHGQLLRSGRRPRGGGEAKVVGLYRAATEPALDTVLRSLPLYDWMDITVTPLGRHPNDPAMARPRAGVPLPDPRLTPVYRLEATLGEPLDLGDTAQGRRRIVPLTGGTFSGPEINGTLLPGASADWQIVLPDGTALGDIRYTLQTDGGDLLYVQSRSVRHGSAEVLARLGRGEDVDASEYTFRTSTQIETAAARLDWLNKGDLRQRRRPPARRRDLRDLPRRMSTGARARRSRSSPARRRGIGAGHRRRSAAPAMPSSAPRARSASSDGADFLTVAATSPIAQTAQRVVEQALDRFGRIDTLVNNAGIFIGKPFTDYTLDDYAAITAVNLAGFFHITQRVIRRWSPRAPATSSTSARASSTTPTARDPRRCRR